MAIKIENVEEIREIKDVEAWLEKLLIEYLGAKEGYIYPYQGGDGSSSNKGYA